MVSLMFTVESHQTAAGRSDQDNITTLVWHLRRDRPSAKVAKPYEGWCVW